MIVTVRVPPASSLRRLGAILAALAVVGWAVPRFLVGDGAGRFPAGTPERAVAEASLRNAWIHADNPIQRLIYLRARVDEVRHVPYHCDRSVGDPEVDAVREYAASVTFHSWFGLPVAGVINECGGEGGFWSAGHRGMPGVRTDRHALVGTWEVASWACPGVCALSSDEARALLGRRLEYGPHRARWDDVSCGPVAYPTRTVTAGAVAADYRLPPGALDLPDRVQSVEVRCDGEAWAWPGGTVLLTGPDRGFVVEEGVFLGIVRVDEGPGGAAAPTTPGCERIEVRAPTLIAFLWLPDEDEEEVVAPPTGLEATIDAFRASLVQARPRLEARGVRTVEYVGSCVEVAAPEGIETLRPRTVTGGAGYLIRGLGVRELLAGVQDASSIVDFATRATG